MKDPEPGVLPSRLHQRGQVLGVDLESLYVCFSDNALVTLPSHLLRLLPTRQASADAHDVGHRARERPCAPRPSPLLLIRGLHELPRWVYPHHGPLGWARWPDDGRLHLLQPAEVVVAATGDHAEALRGHPLSVAVSFSPTARRGRCEWPAWTVFLRRATTSAPGRTP